MFKKNYIAILALIMLIVINSISFNYYSKFKKIEKIIIADNLQAISRFDNDMQNICEMLVKYDEKTLNDVESSEYALKSYIRHTKSRIQILHNRYNYVSKNTTPNNLQKNIDAIQEYITHMYYTNQKLDDKYISVLYDYCDELYKAGQEEYYKVDIHNQEDDIFTQKWIVRYVNALELVADKDEYKYFFKSYYIPSSFRKEEDFVYEEEITEEQEGR